MRLVVLKIALDWPPKDPEARGRLGQGIDEGDPGPEGLKQINIFGALREKREMCGLVVQYI